MASSWRLSPCYSKLIVTIKCLDAASETIVEGMFTPVMDDSKQNEMIEARAYRLLRVGSFLLSEDGYKIFVHESERKQEPRLGEKLKCVSSDIMIKVNSMVHSYR